MERDTETGVGYTAGCHPVLMRGLLVRDRQGAYAPHALLSPHGDPPPRHILPWLVRRWRLEVTCEAARAHLGMEPQSQGSDWAMARTTPGLVGWFSRVTLRADCLRTRPTRPVRLAAGDTKARPTVAEALALPRRWWWRSGHFATLSRSREVVKIPRFVLERFTDAVCYAA